MKSEHTERICPKCGKRYTGHPALSREDGKTEICSLCGSREALRAMGLPEKEIEKVIAVMEKYCSAG